METKTKLYGTYKIPLPADVEPSAYPPVAKLLAKLTPGAQVNIEVIDAPLMINQFDAAVIPSGVRNYMKPATRYCVIRAAGGQVKSVKLRKVASKQPAAPPVPNVEACQKRLSEAESAARRVRQRFAAGLRNGHVTQESYAHEIAHIPAEEYAAKAAEVESWRQEGHAFQPYDPYGEYIRRRQSQCAIGRALARVCAQAGVNPSSSHFRPSKEHYERLDAAAGRRVKRISDLDAHEREAGWLVAILRTHGHGHYESRRAVRNYAYNPNRAEEQERQQERDDRKILCTQYGTGKPWEPPAEQPYNAIAELVTAKLDIEYWSEMIRLHEERKPVRALGVAA